jgi:hypothetical protein
MGSPFASGKRAIALCDRCSQQYLLKELKDQVVKQKRTGLLVCPSCLDQDHPQLMLGTVPVSDPQALRNPRKDNSYYVSGNNGEGSRVIEWGWNPVGGGNGDINPGTTNSLRCTVQVGTVTVTVN